jgi:tetratricopeptide (TPR) repeat protein
MIRRFISFCPIVLLLASAFAAAAPSGRDLVTSGRMQEALSTLNTRVRANPRDAEAYNLLSRAQYSLEHWDAAIDAGERAVAIQPDNSDYHLWLARAYGAKADASNFVVAAGLAGKVRDQFERAVQLDPNNSAARADLAEFYLSAPGFMGGGKDKARQQADLLMKSDPAAAHWIYAVLAEKAKKYDVAEKEFKAAIGPAKDPANRWLDLASFYFHRGRLNEMEDAVNKAMQVPNRPPQTLFDAAIVLYRSGRNLNGAVQMLHGYLSSGDPTETAPDFQAHYLLGQILEKMGNATGAVQEYKAALTEAKDFRKAQTALARLQQ